MATTRIALVQWAPVPGAHERNLRDALALIDAAAEHGPDLIVLPEMWDAGCGPSLAADVQGAAEALDGPRVQVLAGAAKRHGVWLCAGSVSERVPEGVANTALLFDRSGALVGTHRKAHLYTPGGEHEALVAGDALTIVDTEFGPIGLAICFDGDFPEMARALRERGARIVLHPSAYECEAEAWWDRLYPARALENGQWWVSCNQCGSTGGFTMLGASRVTSPLGTVVAEAVRTVRDRTPQPEVLITDVDLAASLAEWDAHCAVLVDGRRPAVYRS